MALPSGVFGDWNASSLVGMYADGDPITAWPDDSGHARDLTDYSNILFIPNFVAVGAAGKPSARVDIFEELHASEPASPIAGWTSIMVMQTIVELRLDARQSLFAASWYVGTSGEAIIQQEIYRTLEGTYVHWVESGGNGPFLGAFKPGMTFVATDVNVVGAVHSGAQLTSRVNCGASSQARTLPSVGATIQYGLLGGGDGGPTTPSYEVARMVCWDRGLAEREYLSAVNEVALDFSLAPCAIDMPRLSGDPATTRRVFSKGRL